MTRNIIENCSISLAAWSSGNLIAENKISNGGGIGIACCGAGNVILGNTISNSGISAYDQGVEINNNMITDCHHGIDISQSPGKISNNTIVNCSIGIILEDYSVEISNNTIVSSAECGISIPDYGDGVWVYNNYFNNTLNVRLGTRGGSKWNNSLTPGTNIVGGPYIGGNFWAHPNGTGFSQICTDSNGDGIGDLPYNVNGSDFDYLPLVSISKQQKPVLPVANFSTNITQNLAPVAIQFRDLSKNAIV